MRVLLVTNDYPPKPGGIQQYLGNLVERYEGPIRVLAPADQDAGTDDRVIRGSSRFMWPTRRVRRWVEHHIADFGADVVVFGAPHPLAHLGPAIERSMGVPFVVVTHGAEVVVPLVIPVLRQWVLKPLRAAGTVFAVSEFSRAKVEAAAERSVRLLGVGVDLAAFSPAAEPLEGFVLGCVSRFVPRKGHDRVIEAVAELRRRGHDVSGLLVGRGRLEGRLRRLAERLEVPVRFEVAVPWERLPGLYREMSMFAMPARTRWFGLEFEGLGIVYLEAAASGLPVVAGTSGGSPETVRVGETGFVGDSTADIVAAAGVLLRDPDRRSAMGWSGRAFVEEQYAWPAVLERFELGLAEARGAKSL